MTTLDAGTDDRAAPRVLIVDDEDVALLALSEILSHEGYQVVTTPDPIAALAFVQREQFALVLTDQRMPKLSGLEFLAQVKQLQPDTTRVLMTGLLELDTIIGAINSGEIFRFVVKPWMREEILVTVKNGVQRYALIRRNAELHRDTAAMNERLASLNQSLAQQVAREAQQNRQLAQLNQALEQNLHRSVELCLKTMETFYPTLGAQARRVFELCQAMAEGLQLSPAERQVLELSASLHDIGLVGVPRRLIKLWQKTPEQLNPAELVLIEHHPVLGQELASFAHHLAGVAGVIRAHHERFDGRGFPDQLAGDNIPWLARLLAVAASFAESGLDEAGTLDVIRKKSGSVFDPEAVRVFARFGPRAAISRNEREILLSELRVGMIVARGIYTSNGMLLMPEGQVLNGPSIEKLKNHNRVNPLKQSLLVYG